MSDKLGQQHPRTQGCMGSLATAYLLTDRLDEAIPLLEQSLKLKTETQGLDHPGTILTMSNLAAALHRAGRLDEALPLAETAAQWLKKNGFKHENAMTILLSTITICEDAAEFEQSDSWRETKLELVQRESGEKSVAAAAELAAWGLALLERGDGKQAEQTLRQCLSIRTDTQPEFWSTFNTQSMLGGALLSQRRFDEAEPLLVSGYEGMKLRETTIPAQAANRIPQALDRLIELYTALEKADELAKYRELRAQYVLPGER